MTSSFLIHIHVRIVQLEAPNWNLKLLLLPLHLGRDPAKRDALRAPILFFLLDFGSNLQPQSIQPDEAGGVVLVVRLCRIGFHRGDVRIVEAHRTLAAGDHDVAFV